MFCKFVFYKLRNIRWPSKVAWNIYQRCLVKMAKVTLHLWLPLAKCYKTGTSLTSILLLYFLYYFMKMALNINGTLKTWHLIKSAFYKNGISKLTLLVFWNTNDTLLIEPTPRIRHKLEKIDFEIPWPWVLLIQHIWESTFKGHSA